MRNPERIDEVLGLIKTIWTKYPDLRFLQLINNLTAEYGSVRECYLKDTVKDGLITSYIKSSYIDGFDVEDDNFIEFLKNKVGETY